MLFFALPIVISYFQYLNYSEADKKTVDVIVFQPNIDPYAEKYLLSNQEVSNLLLQLVADKLDDKVNLSLLPKRSLPRISN